jgi:hypothetical protein
MLEADRLAAVITKIRTNYVKRAAVIAQDFGRVERVYLDLGTTILAVSTEMLETLKIPALTLPVADLVFDIFKSRRLAKIRDWEYRCKYRLEAYVVTFFRDQVHLQKPVIRFALDLDQIWDLSSRIDLGKIHPLGRLADPLPETI